MKNAVKKFIHKFIIDERGAVSIFLIFITILLFLFNAVLIDFARIIIAERQTEEAAKVALRSTMSSYHQSLQDTGLFAFDGNEGTAAEIFKEIFEKNISPNESGNFELLGLQSEENEMSLDIHSERSLANEEILKYQILEEMKYKAPIEVGEAIIKNFLSISEQVEEASNYSKVAKEVNELAEERMEKIEEAKELIEEAQDYLNGVNSLISDDGPTGTYPDIKTTYDIFHYHHGSYLSDLEDIEDAEEEEHDETDEIEQKKADTKTFKKNAENILQAILDAANPAFDNIVEAIDLVQEAKELNEDIISTINDPENTTEDDYDNANEVAESDAGGGVDTSILEDYIMEENFFTELDAHLNEAKTALDTETQNTGALIPKVEKDFLVAVKNDFANREKNKIKNDNDHTNEYYSKAVSELKEALKLIKDTLADYFSNGEMNNDEMEEAIEEEEEAADEEKDNLEDILDEIENVQGINEDTSKLEELGIKSRDYGDASKANKTEFSFEDRDDTADEAMSFIDIIFKGIGDILVNARDKIYINEYILMRFSSHDFEKNVPESLIFENNQVEYIMYGQEVSGMNHFAAVSEIFAVRFAINFTAALINPTNKVFGPLFWAKALSEAFKETAVDMKDILKGDKVDFFPRIRFKMGYQDHLRLFLFIHPDGGKLYRLMAVLDDKVGENLSESPTYVTANATTSIPLWFLPGVAEFLGETNIIEGRVEENKFFIEKEVNFSY